MLDPDEAQALVEKHGSRRGAARAIGVPASTFYYWLHPELNREGTRRWAEANRERDRERSRRRYATLSGMEYNHTLLRHRRDQGRRRMRERHQRQGEEHSHREI